MGHVKSKGTDLQNTKAFKDSKHKEHEHIKISSKPRTSHEKSNPPYKHQT